jgi:protein-tyrosine-phosphatase
MTEKTYNVLFLCTGNSARSIIAEAILNRLGQGRFKAYSAGSHPKGQPHPYAIDLLRKLDFDVEGLRSKSWDEFAAPEGPPLDFVLTPCDDAANERCPHWPGQPHDSSLGHARPRGGARKPGRAAPRIRGHIANADQSSLDLRKPACQESRPDIAAKAHRRDRREDACVRPGSRDA